MNMKDHDISINEHCPCSQSDCPIRGNCVLCVQNHLEHKRHIPECIQNLLRPAVQWGTFAGYVEDGMGTERRLEALAAMWREQAATYTADGWTAPAAMLRRVASELDAARRLDATEALTLHEAAAELGVSYSTVQRHVATGSLRNAGTKHRPRVRRCDLQGDGTGPELARTVLRSQ